MAKRILAFVIVCLLLLGLSVSAAADKDDFFAFHARSTNLQELTAKRWFSSDEKRAALSLLLWADLMAYDISVGETIDLSQDSYVGKSGTILAVYLHGTEESKKDYVFLYQPIDGSAQHMIMDRLSSTFVTLVMESICDEGYYKNDKKRLQKLPANFPNFSRTTEFLK